MGERGTLYKVLRVFKQSRKVRSKSQNLRRSVLLFECLSVFTVRIETALLQCVNAACTLTLLPAADVVLKWVVLAPLYPLTVLVVLFRCKGKIIYLGCRQQQTELFSVCSCLQMFKLSTFIRIRTEIEIKFPLIFTLYSYDINIRVMSFLLLYFKYKSQKLSREWFNTSACSSSKATVVFLTPKFAVSIMR